MLTAEEARQLLDSIDTTALIGLRDRALIAVMVYSFARVCAALGMKVEDYYTEGRRAWFRLHEKGGKRHEVPAHHNAEAYLDAYIEAAGIAAEKKAPLFRSAAGRTRTLTARPMDPNDALRMIKRRARAIGLPHDDLLPHVPGHRHHRLSRERRHHRKRPGDRQPRKPQNHQALRPHQRPDHAR